MATAKKVMVIGFDAPLAPQVYRYAQEGHMPRVKRLLERGVYGANCLPPFPSITPPNWTTLATGATSITHGISDFNVHVPGDPLDVVHQGFDSADVQAEYIWEAAEKVGKRAIVINYPTSWPPRMKEGWQIGGNGLHPNEWRPRDVAQFGEAFRASLAYEQLWSTEPVVLATDLDIVPARRWENAPRAAKLLEAELPLEYRKAAESVKNVTWHALLVDEDGSGYSRVVVAERKDGAQPLADLRVGQWSETIVREFNTASGPHRAAFRLKLLGLSPDGQTMSLYRTSLCALDGWAFPAELAAEIPLVGLPLPLPGWQAFRMGWFGLDTLGEVLELSHQWLSEAAYHLVSHKDWSIYYMHVHTPDAAYHVYSNLADPELAANEEEYAHFHAAEVAMYASLDRLVARITAGVDEEETIILLTSDHGAVPTGHKFYVGQVLQEAGLIAFKPKADEPDGQAEPDGVAANLQRAQAPASGDVPGKFRDFGEVDWAHTKAMVQRACHVYVNLKGRDPQGAVEPADYESVREQIINALYDHTDPETGIKPIALALKREDARILNMGTDLCGDVVYSVRAEFIGQHGGILGTQRYGGSGDLRSLFILSGPGVRQDVVLERTIWLQDVVPTLCYLADLPVPQHCEGAIVYQALEDPNQALNRYQSLERRYEKMRKSLDRAPMC